MLATEVRQEELEKELQLNRTRENLLYGIKNACLLKKINVITECNYVDGDIVYEVKLRCLLIDKNASHKALCTLFNKLTLTDF